MFRKPHPIELLRLPKAERLIEILTTYLAIALGVGILFGGLFAWLASEVIERDFAKINESMLLWIHSFRSDELTNIALFMSDAGSVFGIVTFGLLLCLMLFLKRRYVDIGTLIVTLVGSAAMVFAFKLMFHQVRPHVFQPLVLEKDFSFPSGHSTMSFTLCGFYAWWIVSVKRQDVWRWLLAVFVLGLAFFVALSRLYLGVHWPTDVLGGALLAFAWVGVCVAGQRWLTHRARREKVKEVVDEQPTPLPHQQ